MWAAIILGLASVASAIIAGGVQAKQTREAGEEAYSGAMQQRQDDLTQASFENRMNKKSASLREAQLSNQSNLLNKNIALNKEQEQYALGKANNQNISTKINDYFGNNDESYLYKSRMLSRF